MFGKVKRWFGIEGVKLELVLPEEVSAKDGEIQGILRFQSMNTQTVTSIKVVLIEKYARGRSKEKLIDEYELGSIQLEQEIEIVEGEPAEVDFTLPFSLLKSDMDELQDKNFLLRGVVSTAKYFRGVKSEYRLEAEAKVKGTALNPFDKKEIKIKR